MNRIYHCGPCGEVYSDGRLCPKCGQEGVLQ